MLVELSMFPLGKKEGLSEDVAKAVALIKESGLDYQLTAMGTLIEGDWDEIMDLIGRCRLAMLEQNERIYWIIKADDHKGRTGKIKGKVGSVEGKLQR